MKTAAPNKKTLISAIANSMRSELDDENEPQPINPAIVYDLATGEFAVESALHGGSVVVDLRGGWENMLPERLDECADMGRLAADLMWQDVLDKICEDAASVICDTD